VKAFEGTELAARFDKYLAAIKEGRGIPATTWSVLDISDIKTGGTKFTKLPDGSLLRVGETPAKDVYTFTARTDAIGITAVRLEALTHDSFPKHGPGLAPNGNFVLGAFDVTAGPADGSRPAEALKLVKATATHEQDTSTLSVAATLDKDPVSGWAVDKGGIGKDQAAVFRFDKPVEFSGGTVFTFRLRFEHPNKQHAIGRPRLSVTTLPQPPAPSVGIDAPPADVAGTLNELAAGRTVDSERVETVRHWFGTTLPDYQTLLATMVERGWKLDGDARAALRALRRCQPPA